MVLKSINSSVIENTIFKGIAGIIFILVLFFFTALLVGLISYDSIHTLFTALNQPEFYFALHFTIFTSVCAIILSTVTALPCGYILARRQIPLSSILDTLLDIPIILPPLVSGIALLILFGPIAGNSLAKAGINVVFTPLGVVVAQWFIAMPFAVKSFKQAFLAIDPRMESIARTLGFSATQVFFKVTIPLAKTGLISGIMMAWSRTLGEFGATAMLAGITRMKTETLSVAVFLNMSIGDINFAIATAIVMLFFALSLLIILRLFIHQRL